MDKETYTYDWFSGNASEWPRLLKPYANVPGLNFLEIGSFEGKSASWLLRNVLTHPTSRLTCIDLFPDSLGGDMELMPLVTTPNKTFDANMLANDAGSRVIKIRGASENVLRTLAPAAYDFIYIDGSHNAPHVLSDAVLCWHLLKLGGLVCFDDYEWGEEFPPLERPQAAIDAFMHLYDGMYELVDKGYQVTLRKTAHLALQAELRESV